MTRQLYTFKEAFCFFRRNYGKKFGGTAESLHTAQHQEKQKRLKDILKKRLKHLFL